MNKFTVEMEDLKDRIKALEGEKADLETEIDDKDKEIEFFMTEAEQLKKDFKSGTTGTTAKQQ